MPPPIPSSSDATPKSDAPRTPAPGPAGTDPGSPQSQPLATDYAAILELPRHPDELGRLGDYRIRRLIGAGAMGFVFEAEEPMPKRNVAIKVMRPELAAQPEAKERFLREANAAAALNNDHVVTIFRVGTVRTKERELLFLVMPLMRGETLQDRLKRAPKLPPDEAVRVGRETAEGLAAAHAAGLIHRDIKPENLWLVAESGRVKILDFGLARHVAGGTSYTTPGTVVGTPAYMAPEQARGGAVDARADLFSLGVVLYQLTTGRRPFQGDDILALLCSLAMDHPPPPRAIDPEVPAALSDLVMQLLAKRPGDRPRSAAGVVAALKAIGARAEPLPQQDRGRRPGQGGLARLWGRLWNRDVHPPSGGPPRESGRVEPVPAPAAPRPPIPSAPEGSWPSLPEPVRPDNRPPADKTLMLHLDGGVTLECVRIPAGTFLMGSADGDGDEKPPHRVTISKPYYLGKFAVTVGQFRRFVEATGYRTEAEADGRGGYGLTAGDQCVQNPVFTWTYTGFPQTVDHPVVNVSWNDAMAFCDWLSNKTEKTVLLPTEAEWEYGCRTPTPDQARFNASVWYLGNTNGKGTRPCGQKLPNAWGLYDTLGNVSEWCRDGKRTYASRDETDPVGPMVGGCSRVFRGGSFNNAPRHCCTACRNSYVPSGRFAFLGFRVSLSR